MSDWKWVNREMIEAVHQRQIAEHGGGSGTRDENVLESALARPINLALYTDPDAAALAASLAFGLARNHAFVDGNKRSAWVGARLFLRLNRIAFAFDLVEATITMQRLASGELGEDELARGSAIDWSSLADWSRALMVHDSPSTGRKRYGPGTSRSATTEAVRRAIPHIAKRA